MAPARAAALCCLFAAWPALEAIAQAEDATPAEDAGLPLTKVVVPRQEIDGVAEQDGYGDAVRRIAGAMSNNARGSANDAIRFRGLQLAPFSNYRLNGGLAITNVITLPTENKERIEALKGANALMFGLASPAGILNLVTKRAGKTDVATVNLRGNHFGQSSAAVDLGRQFGAQREWGLRLNASTTQIETGTRGIGGTGQFFSLAGDWKPVRELVIWLDYENYRKDVVEQAGIAPPAAVNGVIAVPRVPDPRVLLSGPWDLYKPRTETAALRAVWSIEPGWSALVELGRSRAERSRTQVRITLNNVLTGDGAQSVLFVRDQRFENTFARAELQGKLDAGGVSHVLTLGYALAQRDANGPSTYAPAAASNNRPINIYAATELAAPADPGTPLTYKPNRSRDAGLYLYDRLALAESLALLVGLRQSRYEFSQALVPNGPLETTRYHPAAGGLGLLYHVTPASTLYASVMQAMEDGPSAPSGPIQGRAVSNAFAVLEPTVSTQRELGLRSSAWPGLFVNAALFDIARKNTNLIADSPTSLRFQYDGSLRLYGLELQTRARLASDWELAASGQWMRARQQGGANDGKTPENTPGTIASAQVQHRAAWAPGLALRLGASWVGARFIGNAEQGSIPAVTLYSAGASYQTASFGTRLLLQLGIENLANKRYWNSVTSVAFGAGMDRSVRFGAKLEF